MSRGPYGGAYLGRPPYTGKLSREDVQEVLRLYETGMTGTAIAKQFGVVPSAIAYQLSKHTVTRRNRPAVHGTKAQYKRERRQGRPCEACRLAYNEHMRVYVAARRAAAKEKAS